MILRASFGVQSQSSLAALLLPSKDRKGLVWLQGWQPFPDVGNRAKLDSARSTLAKVLIGFFTTWILLMTEEDCGSPCVERLLTTWILLITDRTLEVLVWNGTSQHGSCSSERRTLEVLVWKGS